MSVGESEGVRVRMRMRMRDENAKKNPYCLANTKGY